MRDAWAGAHPAGMNTTDTYERFTALPDDQTLAATVVALEEHGSSVEVVDDLDAAREAVLARIPDGSSVMTNTITARARRARASHSPTRSAGREAPAREPACSNEPSPRNTARPPRHQRGGRPPRSTSAATMRSSSTRCRFRRGSSLPLSIEPSARYWVGRPASAPGAEGRTTATHGRRARGGLAGQALRARPTR
jgi:hypothetical protein